MLVADAETPGDNEEEPEIWSDSKRFLLSELFAFQEVM